MTSSSEVDATLPSSEKLQNNTINGDTESHVSVEKIASTSDDDVSKGVENNDVTEKPDEVIEKDESASQSKVMTSSDNGIMISEQQQHRPPPQAPPVAKPRLSVTTKADDVILSSGDDTSDTSDDEKEIKASKESGVKRK